ncbi:MAG: hypothetical protein E5V58_12985 [Mesorhizobium sp.]|nr:MAG: hypothetical protein E5V58_12985 [Mesorhizobium sp.]
MKDETPLYDVLRDILADVNQWLQYGEAKNGIMITVNLALIVGIGTVVTAWENVPVPIVVAGIAISIGLLVGSMFSLVSFFPKLQKHSYAPADRALEGGNLLFFGDIEKYAPRSYLEALAASLGAKVGTHRLHEDLASQIVTNSIIATKKFKLFAIALRVSAYAIFFPVVAGLSYWGSL